MNNPKPTRPIRQKRTYIPADPPQLHFASHILVFRGIYRRTYQSSAVNSLVLKFHKKFRPYQYNHLTTRFESPPESACDHIQEVVFYKESYRFNP